MYIYIYIYVYLYGLGVSSGKRPRHYSSATYRTAITYCQASGRTAARCECGWTPMFGSPWEDWEVDGVTYIMGHRALTWAQPQRECRPWAGPLSHVPCPMSHGPVPWPGPMSDGLVLCPMGLSYVPWPRPLLWLCIARRTPCRFIGPRPNEPADTGPLTRTG